MNEKSKNLILNPVTIIMFLTIILYVAGNEYYNSRLEYFGVAHAMFPQEFHRYVFFGSVTSVAGATWLVMIVLLVLLVSVLAYNLMTRMFGKSGSGGAKGSKNGGGAGAKAKNLVTGLGKAMPGWLTDTFNQKGVGIVFRVAVFLVILLAASFVVALASQNYGHRSAQQQVTDKRQHYVFYIKEGRRQRVRARYGLLITGSATHYAIYERRGKKGKYKYRLRLLGKDAIVAMKRPR